MTVQDDPLQREQDAFDATLPELLRDHHGEFVVFKNEHPVGFYVTFDEAFREALTRFGLDSGFLVSEVSATRRTSSSLSWDLGVL